LILISLVGINNTEKRSFINGKNMAKFFDSTATMSRNTRRFGIILIILSFLAISTPLVVGVSILLLVGLLVLGGIISFLLGLMIWMQYPLSGALAIGVLLGIKLLFVGMTLFTVGSSIQSVR
jgi:uncharacterized membrane protein HdeD (DUF308 family)